MIKIYEPSISDYTSSALKAIETGWISNHGTFIEEAESLCKNIFKIPYVILMCNGTCATHCLFLALKFKHPEIKKIYVPSNCYVAAWNALLMTYDASCIEVLDLNEETWNMNLDNNNLQKLEPNSAVFVVHNLGNIIPVPELKKKRPDLVFLEDNCEGFLGKFSQGEFAGMSSESLCSSVSFYGNKIITTGEGGAFFTHDKDVYQHLKLVYSQGMSTEKRYLHMVHAYNYRISNIQAGFLCDQLKDLDSILAKKKKVFHNYLCLLKPLVEENKISLFREECWTEKAPWIFAVRIHHNPKSIQETHLYFLENKVEIRPFFYPIYAHNHLAFLKEKVYCPVGEVLNREVIMIPSSPEITMEEQAYVVDILRSFIYKE